MKGVIKEEEWKGDELTQYILYDDMVRMELDFERLEVRVMKKMTDGVAWDTPMELTQPRRDLFRIWREQLSLQILRKREFVKKNIKELKQLQRLGVPLEEGLEEMLKEESRESLDQGEIKIICSICEKEDSVIIDSNGNPMTDTCQECSMELENRKKNKMDEAQKIDIDDLKNAPEVEITDKGDIISMRKEEDTGGDMEVKVKKNIDKISLIIRQIFDEDGEDIVTF